jgi:CubicO group peptidase (beta-lactamase class C family)
MDFPPSVLLALVLVAHPAAAQWSANHDLTEAQYQSVFQANSANGYRLIDASVTATSAGPRIAAIWESRTGPPRGAYHGLTSASLATQMSGAAAAGFRPVLIDSYLVSGSPRFLGLWEKWQGFPVLFDESISWADWPATLALRSGAGYRPLRVDVRGGSGGTVTALWEQNPSPEWRMDFDLAEDGLAKALANRAAENFIPVRIGGFGNGASERLIVIYEKKPCWPRVADAGQSAAGFQTVFNQRNASGYRPVSIGGYEVEGVLRHAAIWEKTARPAMPNVYPESGLPRSGLSSLDTAMRQFMTSRSISAGTLCLAKGDTIVYERSFGWQDHLFAKPLRPNVLMRTASLAKPVTAAAVRKLVADGQIALTDHAFALGQPGGGILAIAPHGTADSRLKDITIQHLLDHAGGWNRDVSGDPMFNALAIAADLNVTMPPTQPQIISWVTGRPLDFTPGTGYAYSNFGYLVLGQIIEKVTGTDATAWIRQHIFEGAGIPGNDFRLARTLPEHRDPREPSYFENTFGTFNVYQPSAHARAPDGTWDIEVMEAHGGWISSARAYTAFLTKYWINSGLPRTGGSQDHTFFGSLQGTWSAARQRTDGVSYTAIFNQRTDASSLSYESIVTQLDTAISNITNWPATDPATIPTVAPPVSVQGQTISWPRVEGRFYQVFESPDLGNWNPIGNPMVGGFIQTTLSFNISQWLGSDRRFFRIEVE